MGNTLSLTFPLESVAACHFSSSWQFSASSLLAVSTALPEISPQASSLTDSSPLLAANPVDNSDKPSSLTLSPTPWVGHTSQAGRLPTWGRCTEARLAAQEGAHEGAAMPVGGRGLPLLE